jgi:hypothetical protein
MMIFRFKLLCPFGGIKQENGQTGLMRSPAIGVRKDNLCDWSIQVGWWLAKPWATIGDCCILPQCCWATMEIKS